MSFFPPLPELSIACISRGIAKCTRLVLPMKSLQEAYGLFTGVKEGILSVGESSSERLPKVIANLFYLAVVTGSAVLTEHMGKEVINLAEIDSLEEVTISTKQWTWLGMIAAGAIGSRLRSPLEKTCKFIGEGVKLGFSLSSLSIPVRYYYYGAFDTVSPQVVWYPLSLEVSKNISDNTRGTVRAEMRQVVVEV